MSRDQVRLVMGNPPDLFYKSEDSRFETDGFHECSFQIFYEGEKPQVEYIELSENPGFHVFYRGQDVFNTEATKLVSIIAEATELDGTHQERGYTFIFPALELSLWRPVMPESENDPGGRFFSTIGIGVKGYFSKTAA